MAANADREVERRQQVSEHYSTYLEAANAYYAASGSFVGAVDHSSGDENEIAQEELQIESAFAVMQQTRNDYLAAANDVYAFGSEDAWVAHQQVFAVLLPHDPRTVQRRGPVHVAEPIEFFSAQNAFLRVFCQEAVAQPRTDCTRVLKQVRPVP